MDEELRSSPRRGGLIIDVIIWVGISAGILLELLSTIIHNELFAWLALMVMVAVVILGAATPTRCATRYAGC